MPAIKHKKHDVRTLQIAARLVEHHARGGIIELVTGVSSKVVQGLYRDVHGGRPPGGPLPTSSLAYLKRHRSQRVAAQLFIRCLHREMGESIYSTTEIEPLLRAYETYLLMEQGRASENDEPLSFSHCWVIARDIITRQLLLRECGCCGGLYPWEVSPRLTHCAVCERAQKEAGIQLERARTGAAARSRIAAAIERQKNAAVLQTEVDQVRHDHDHEISATQLSDAHA